LIEQFFLLNPQMNLMIHLPSRFTDINDLRAPVSHLTLGIDVFSRHRATVQSRTRRFQC